MGDATPFLPFELPLLQVQDSQKKMCALGSKARQMFAGKVIGITGSSGKTTVTHFLAHILGSLGAMVGCSQASANMPFGVGWNMANMPQHSPWWVVEMAIGGMQNSAKMVQPHVALVLNVHPAHLVYWKNTQAIAVQKSRIFSHMLPGSTAVVCRDMDEYPIFEQAASQRGLRLLTFGSHASAQFRFLQYRQNTLHYAYEEKSHTCLIGDAGQHMAMNGLAALAVLSALDVSQQEYTPAVTSFAPLVGRGRRIEITTQQSAKIRIIDESYNANPDSMRAALLSLANLEPEHGKRVVILGDMLELGDDALPLHRALQNALDEVQPDRVLLCGPLMHNLWEQCRHRHFACWFATLDELKEGVLPLLKDGDSVLVKSSHGMGLHTFVEWLQTAKKTAQPSSAGRQQHSVGYELAPALSDVRCQMSDVRCHVNTAPPPAWDAATVAEVSGGQWLRQPPPAWRSTGVNLWTSNFMAGHMVFARGDRKGGTYCTLEEIKAREKNIAAVICQDPAHYQGSLPTLLVPDISQVTKKLGLYARRQFQGKVIGVTGSCGKTTTVNMLSKFLGMHGLTSHTRYNQNLELGIAQSMASMRFDADFWVLEISVGATGSGAKMAQLDAAVVTTVSEAHLNWCGSLEGVARDKSLILDAVCQGGTAILNRDMPFFDLFAEKARENHLQIMTFGAHVEADVRCLHHTPAGVHFSVHGTESALSTALPAHLLLNMLGAVAAMRAFDLPVESILQLAQNFEPMAGRGKVHYLKVHDLSLTVIDDSFNATPLSMHSGLRHLAFIAEQPRSRVAIMGDIARLGDAAVQHHVAIKNILEEVRPDRVLLCGPLMRRLWYDIEGKYAGFWFESVQELLQALPEWLRNGDVIFVKGSTPSGLQKVVARLLSMAKAS